MWIKQNNVKEVRGDIYPRLINLETGIHIFIDTTKDQKETDLNLSVWGMYPGNKNEIKLFEGTQVECLKILDKYAERLNAQEITPWD